MDTWDLLLQIVLLLLACFVAGSLMAMVRQSPLVGFLLAGMVVGGHGSLEVVKAESAIEGIAELGVAMLLFSLGLEFSWSRVLGLGKLNLLCGVLQVLLTMAALTAAGLALNLGLSTSLAISAMVSLSSTATVLGVLTDRALLDSPMGRNSIAVLLVQDMAVVPLALLIPLLGESGDAESLALRVGGIAIAGAGVVTVLYLTLNMLAVRVMKTRSIGQNRELMVVLSVIVGLGATWAAHAARLSPALGAFVAGMFLGNSPFAFQIRADVASLRIVLLTLFFGSVGLLADPIWMFRNLLLVLAMSTLILSVKVMVVAVLFRVLRHPSGTSLGTGLCLGSVGEFAFVLGSQAMGAGLITEDQYNALVSAAIISLLVTPTLITYAPGLASWLNGHVFAPLGGASRDELNRHAWDCLLVGFGPAGRGAAEALSRQASQVLVVDLGADGVNSARAAGFHAMQADATTGEILQHLHPERLKLVVITVPGFHDSMAVLQQIRHMAPDAKILVRSRYRLHQQDFRDAGADIVVGDEEEVGTALCEAIQKLRTA
ncbi:MAG: Glutathione-regulated potassium-efflux system protein KefC [Planctomycetota bacterium]